MERKTRVMREIDAREAYLLEVLAVLQFAKADVEKRDGQLRTVDLKIRINFDRLEEFQQILGELKNIPILQADMLQ